MGGGWAVLAGVAWCAIAAVIGIGVGRAARLGSHPPAAPEDDNGKE